MPTGGWGGEYQALCDAIKGSSCDRHWSISGTDTNSLQYNLSTPLSGDFVDDGYAYGQGIFGVFWASTYIYGFPTYMNLLDVRADSIDLFGYNDRTPGFSIRCLLNS